MAAHPGLSIPTSFLRETSGLTTTPQVFRHRYHTRRKRSTTTVGMAAVSGSGGSSGKVSRRDTSDGSVSGARNSSVATLFSSDSQPEHPPEEENENEDGASDMRIDVDTAVLPPTSRTHEDEDQSSCRWGRVLSCPAVEHRRAAAASDGATAVRPFAATAVAAGLGGAFVVAGSADNVSSARGITFGDIHGSVRAKSAATAVEEQPPKPPSTSAESAAATAVETATAIADHYSDIAASEVVAMSLGGGGGGEAAAIGGTSADGNAGDSAGERVFRATSSGASFVSEPVQEASNKRAKSGVVVGGGGALGDDGAWMAPETANAAAAEPERRSQLAREGQEKGEAHPTPAEAMSSMSIESKTAAATPPAENGHDAAAGTATAAAAAAAAPAPANKSPAATEAPPTPVTLSNEEWLARLSPLLESIPAGTHPEDHLHDILRERGYTTEMVAMKETIFHRPPEADQVAAYDKAILRAVVDEDEPALERMRAAGRRMDACNRFGDSVLHMACRRGRATALRFLLRATGPSGVVLSDDFGRTVMHDACWTAAPRFDVASAVLDSDTRLLRTLDSRGSSPLQYVPQDQWPLWCAFFESRKEVYWPQLPPGTEDLAGIIPLTV